MTKAVYVVLSVGYWLVLFFLAAWCTEASNRIRWEWKKGNRSGTLVIWIVIALIRFAVLVAAMWGYMGWSISHR